MLALAVLTEFLSTFISIPVLICSANVIPAEYQCKRNSQSNENKIQTKIRKSVVVECDINDDALFPVFTLMKS